MRILIADDQAAARSALRLLLEQMSAQERVIAEEASGLGEALTTAPPDLILLDWELPPDGGAVALRELRAAWPEARVIAMSGRPEARAMAQAAGVDAFVSKGEAPRALLDALGRCVETDHDVRSQADALPSKR
jgi:DNA-binding NarL/FixJ family response regulator